MSFDKRDYLYDDHPSTITVLKEDLEERENTRTYNKDKFPKEWVQDLLFELQDASKAKGVELLDRCTLIRLARFVSRYSEDVWED
jgi:hypothetical protein